MPPPPPVPPFPDHDGPYSKDVNQNKPFLSSLSCFAQHFVTSRRTATKLPCVVTNLKWLAEGHHHHCHTTLSLLSSPPSHCLAGGTGITQNCREPAEAPSRQQPTEKASPGTSQQPGFLNKALLFSHFFVPLLIYTHTLQALWQAVWDAVRSRKVSPSISASLVGWDMGSPQDASSPHTSCFIEGLLPLYYPPPSLRLLHSLTAKWDSLHCNLQSPQDAALCEC